MAIAAFLSHVALLVSYSNSPTPPISDCNSILSGYQCQPNISHHWGQYSPYFTIPSDISAALPSQCNITFAQILSRHGARYPTASKSAAYNATVAKIKSSVTSYTGASTFLESYNYTLGADELTSFGELELYDSGVKFYARYATLAKHFVPFIRASSESRVVVSAQQFALGFNAEANSTAKGSNASLSVIISEADGSNNTLNHGLCTAFEDGPDSDIATYAQGNFTTIFLPEIKSRISASLPGTNLTSSDIINLMDLCPYETVTNSDGQPLSPFCALFTEDEWRSYDYYQTLGKYYGYGGGNPLGSTNGVGWTNELIARLTGKAVADHTSTNSTLDSNPTTFPLGRRLYGDFSHDNDMTGIFFAMGLYDQTRRLSNSSIESTVQTKAYSAAWTVPFAARMYVEKMSCQGRNEELVRILVNDRVIPLQGCGADKLGRCKLSGFVESLSFARDGGDWNQCFV